MTPRRIAAVALRAALGCAVVVSLAMWGCGDVSEVGESGSDAIVDQGPSADVGDDTAEVAPDTPMEDAGVADTAPGDAAADTPSAPPASPCSYPLVELRTGQDTSCAGGNSHLWPIGMAAADCHGWSAVDPTGKAHENSANAIGCNADGSFSFTQFAGNLDCQGTGVVKTFVAGACEQDTPPVLYTQAVNLACCSDPSSSDCVTGLPAVSVPGGQVFLNGEPCQ